MYIYINIVVSQTSEVTNAENCTYGKSDDICKCNLKQKGSIDKFKDESIC